MLTIQDKNLCAEISAIASASGQSFEEVIKEMLEAYKDKHPLVFRYQINLNIRRKKNGNSKSKSNTKTRTSGRK